MPRKRVIRLRNPQDPKKPFVRVESKPGIRWSSCDMATSKIRTEIYDSGLDDEAAARARAAPYILFGGILFGGLSTIIGPIMAVFPFTPVLAPISLSVPATTGVVAGSVSALQALQISIAGILGLSLMPGMTTPEGATFVKFEQPCDEHAGRF